MADKNLLSQMLEHLVNDDQAKAEELFHEYVVTASREIYENLIESELKDEEVEEATDEDEDEAVEEASEDDEESMEEAFGDDEGGMMGGDATDDLEGELDAGDEMDGEEPAEKGEEELFQDLEAIVDELQAKFDELKGIESDEHGDEFGGDEFGGEDEPEEEGFELATVREYVEKVPAGHGAEKKGAAEKADNTKSLVDNMKNDMGGTTANILSGRDGAQSVDAASGQLKGSSLIKQKPTEDNAGNVNVPGGNVGKTSFKKKEPGHGAEKAGSKESADNKQSLFRGRR